jgi:hypothetical protein
MVGDSSGPPKGCHSAASWPWSWARASRPEDVVGFVGRGRSSVCTRLKAAREGVRALVARPHPGRTPRPGEADRERREGLFLQGAVAYGRHAERQTAARVADDIGRRLRVGFHFGHVREVLGRKTNRPAGSRRSGPGGAARWLSATEGAGSRPRPSDARFTSSPRTS